MSSRIASAFCSAHSWNSSMVAQNQSALVSAWALIPDGLDLRLSEFRLNVVSHRNKLRVEMRTRVRAEVSVHRNAHVLL